ncbi:MAG: hypothetical protein IJZ29_05280 [Clostridia bacterium]|nr:hypothetical protein [Clostridia bacterium]
MDIEKIKDDYFNQCILFKNVKKDYFLQILSQINSEDRELLKELLTSKIKETISQITNNGKKFQTESVTMAQQQFSQTILDNFRNAILNSKSEIEANIWESPKSFRNIIANMSYDELNEFYSQCLSQQQKLISLYSQENNAMFFDYYNRDLIENIEILTPLLSFDYPYQSKRNVVGGNSFWGRKNNSLSKADSAEILKTLGFYKNLLIAIDNNIFCDTQIGFLNESISYNAQDIEKFLLENNPNICEYQHEYIIQTEVVNSMLRCPKSLLKSVVVNDNNKFEIYRDSLYKDLFVLQYKITPNNFANRINNTTNATKCEIILFYLPDKSIFSAFQLGRLDMYSENNYHKPYGMSRIDTLAHIHIYSIEDAALNNKFYKDHKEINLAHYDMIRNLPKSATYEEFEMYFRKICGMGLTQNYKQFYNNMEKHS